MLAFLLIGHLAVGVRVVFVLRVEVVAQLADFPALPVNRPEFLRPKRRSLHGDDVAFELRQRRRSRHCLAKLLRVYIRIRAVHAQHADNEW